MAELGRRTGLGGVVKNADPNIFNPDWGIQTETPLVPIKFPTEDVITRSVNFISNKLQKTILYGICSRFFRKYGWGLVKKN